MSSPMSCITLVVCLLLLATSCVLANNDTVNPTLKTGVAPLPSTVAPTVPIVANATALPAVAEQLKPEEGMRGPISEAAAVAKVNQTLLDMIRSAPLVVSNATEKGESKFALYFKPICECLDKIKPKKFFKIQSELKQFVQLTNAKLSVCFLEAFKVDPGMRPIEKADISVICASRNLPPEAEGSFCKFEKCAADNWDITLDHEFQKICLARENHMKRHPQHLNGSRSALLDDYDDDEDIILISDVVNNVMTGDKNSSSDVSIKMYDGGMSTFKPGNLAMLPTMVPVAPGSPNQTKLMNDPNTVLVLVDNSNATTVQPTDPSAVLSKPSVVPEEVKTNATSTRKPLPAPTTVCPIVTSTIGPKHVKTAESVAKVSSAKSNVTTTHKPTASLSIKPTDASSAKKSYASEISAKQSSGLEELTRRQEKALKELQDKFKIEREQFMIQNKKVQDDIEAQNAIKSLFQQKQISADKKIEESKLHHLEHQRQMSIDPIGHTIKHQQYEMKKKAKENKN